MTNPIDPIELEAYADGELPDPRRAEVARLLSLDPDAARRVEDLRKLREAAGAALRSTPGPSEDLRRRIGLLSGGPRATPVASSGRVHRWRTRGLLGLGAAAAVVLLGAWLVVRSGVVAFPGAAGSTLVPAALVRSITEQHLGCSALADHFLSPGFPRVEKELASAMSRFLAREATPPDLASRGYTFAGAGPCRLPGGTTLHLLYRSPGGKDTVSIFLQPDEGQLALPGGRAVVAAGPDREHPILIWRADGLVHYLVADSVGDASSVAAALGRSF